MDDLVERVAGGIRQGDLTFTVLDKAEATSIARVALAVVAEWLDERTDSTQQDPAAAIRQQIGGAGEAKESGDGG